MKILQFLQGLLPHIEKSNLVEDLRITIAELDNVCLQNYEAASMHFKASKLKSPINKDLSDTFYKNFDLQSGGKQASFIGEINRRLVFAKQNAQYLLESAENLMEKDVFAEGLTVRKALIIRAAESISFASRFSLDLLNYVYVNEAMEVNAEVEESLKLSPAAIKFIDRHIAKFSRIVSDYGIPTADFSKIVGSVPEVIINSKTANSIMGLYKEKEIDPFASSYLVGFTGSPIYHIRLLVAEWQSNRYKANKEKKKMLELRLLHLKLLQDKKHDPKIEQEINYIQSRVDKIDKSLREVEESLEKGD